MRILVLGIGNILLQDEGIGVRVVEQLKQRYEIPSEVTVLDGGTAGMALLDDILDAQQVIVVDAVKTGDPPGTIVRFAGDQVPALLQQGITPHQLGLFDLLGALTFAGCKPPQLVLFGVVPQSLELSLDLSSTLAAKLDPVIERVVAELASSGVVLKPCDTRSSADVT
jgi:hydrogenase maturation protease